MQVNKHVFIFIILTSFIVGIVLAPYSNRIRQTYRQNRVDRVLAAAVDRCAFPTDDRTKRITCIKNRITWSVEKYGIRTFMDALSRSVDIPNCHDVAHVIGKIGALYTKISKESLSACTRTCGDGCAHGVLEGYISSGGNLKDAVTSLCRDTDYSCFHGLGHGIATTIGDIQKSLHYCDPIAAGEGKDQCAYGIFMELYESSTFGHPMTPLPDDVVSFCHDIPDQYRNVCLSKSGIHEYTRTRSVVAAGSACSKVPDTKTCYEMLGVLLYWQYQNDPAGLAYACRQTDGIGTYCIGGVISESVNIDPKAKMGFRVCSHVPLQYTKSCFRTLGISIGLSDLILTPGESPIDSVCNEFKGEPQIYSVCVAGIGRGLSYTREELTTAGLLHTLRLCESISIDPGVCFNGMMGEFADRSIASNTHNRIDCTDMPVRFQPTCYFWHMKILHEGYKQDPAALGNVCKTIQVQRNREECYGGIGRIVTSDSVYTRESVESDCSRMPDEEGRAFCLIEAMRSLYTDEKTNPQAVCHTLGPRLRDICVAAGNRFDCHVMKRCQDIRNK